ncbi:MAG: ABC transporter permease subunit [Planctomycetes bacterium]|nr:ABC transporter permease subunit [Planctomycetota bacterium]
MSAPAAAPGGGARAFAGALARGGVRAMALATTLLGLLAAVFLALHSIPRARAPLHLDGDAAPQMRRDAERERRELLRDEGELPLFAAWPPLARGELVARQIERLRREETRALAVAWLRWLGAAARAEWTSERVAELGAAGLALPELGLPADPAGWSAAVLDSRVERAVIALRAGTAASASSGLASELAELELLLVEPIASALVAGASSAEAERMLAFAESLPAVGLPSSGTLEARRARLLAWWDTHAIYLARAPRLPAPLAALADTRFARWIARALRGDLGRDTDQRSIAAEIAQRLAVTLPLAAVALLLAFGAALPASGYLAARRAAGRGWALERALLALHVAPGFWIALLLLALFSSGGPLGFLPGSWSSTPAPEGALPRLAHALARAALPLLALALPAWAYLVRQRSAALREALVSPFARAARARGLDERAVQRAHAAPHARFVMLALVGAAFPALVTGSVVVETLFEVPGVGRYAYEGLLARDVPRVLALTALAGIATWLGWELAEAGLRRADPRRRATEGPA